MLKLFIGLIFYSLLSNNVAQVLLDSIPFNINKGCTLFKIDTLENSIDKTFLGEGRESLKFKRDQISADYKGFPTGKKRKIYVKTIEFNSLGLVLTFIGMSKNQLYLKSVKFTKVTILYLEDCNAFCSEIERNFLLECFRRNNILFEEKNLFVLTKNIGFHFNTLGELTEIEIQ
jgi:hypothetical protein